MIRILLFAGWVVFMTVLGIILFNTAAVEISKWWKGVLLSLSKDSKKNETETKEK